MRASRTTRAALALSLLATLAITAPVQANHAFGTLDCGSAGTYDVDGTGTLPPGFQAPGPGSGLFLLEGTTMVFRALTIDGQAFPYRRPQAAGSPGGVISCTLTSAGFGFGNGPWSLTGILVR